MLYLDDIAGILRSERRAEWRDLSVSMGCSKKEGRSPSGLSAGFITRYLLSDPGTSLQKDFHTVGKAMASCQGQGCALQVICVGQKGPSIQQQLQHLCMALQE